MTAETFEYPRNVGVLWDNENGPRGAGNTIEGLTHSLDLGKEGLPMNGTRFCSVDGCDKQTEIRKGLCEAHYARAYRYGSPTFHPQRRRADLSGVRFGSLTARTPIEGAWLCDCDCGATGKRVTTWRLKSGRAKSCGCRWGEWRQGPVTYLAAHDRVRRVRGRAGDLPCVDCSGPASHWSYMGGDPDELFGPPRSGSLTASPYSLDVWRYEPRCVPCHSKFDRK